MGRWLLVGWGLVGEVGGVRVGGVGGEGSGWLVGGKRLG